VALKAGGAIYERDAHPLCRRLRARNTVLSNNTAGGAGGGVHAGGMAGFSVALTNVTVRANRAATDGGGIYLQPGGGNATLSIAGSSFSGNTAGSGSGGGAFAGSGVQLAVAGSRFVGDSAGGPGGSIACLNCSGGYVNTTSFTSSSAGYGGGLASIGASRPLTLGASNFTGGSAQSVGGWRLAGTLGRGLGDTMRGLPLGAGGALYVDGARGETYVDKGVISGNAAGNGGARRLVAGQGHGGWRLLCYGCLAAGAELWCMWPRLARWLAGG
jgi:hypothetical protein